MCLGAEKGGGKGRGGMDELSKRVEDLAVDSNGTFVSLAASFRFQYSRSFFPYFSRLHRSTLFSVRLSPTLSRSTTRLPS